MKNYFLSKSFWLSIVAIILFILAGAAEIWYFWLPLSLVGGGIMGYLTVKAYLYDENEKQND